MFSTNA